MVSLYEEFSTVQVVVEVMHTHPVLASRVSQNRYTGHRFLTPFKSRVTSTGPLEWLVAQLRKLLERFGYQQILALNACSGCRVPRSSTPVLPSEGSASPLQI